MLINACVVEHPLIAPNCCLSSLSLTNSRIQPPTIDSNTFDSVEGKDIGRRSDSIFLGELILGIGTTLDLVCRKATNKQNKQNKFSI